ncbi:MAG: hypothetical protein V2A74_06510 [bacterium]
MKKKLILVILALAILTSLTAGTLAVYTRTVTDTEQIEAKRFAFSAAGKIAGDSASINLAPTESMEYDFNIANVDEKNGPVAEVPMQFDVTINFQEAFSKMPGLKATLYFGEEKVGEYADGQIKYSTQSSANVLFDKAYKVVLTWEDNGNDSGHTTAGIDKVTMKTGLTLTVVATQAI